MFVLYSSLHPVLLYFTATAGKSLLSVLPTHFSDQIRTICTREFGDENLYSIHSNWIRSLTSGFRLPCWWKCFLHLQPTIQRSPIWRIWLSVLLHLFTSSVVQVQHQLVARRGLKKLTSNSSNALWGIHLPLMHSRAARADKTHIELHLKRLHSTRIWIGVRRWIGRITAAWTFFRLNNGMQLCRKLGLRRKEIFKGKPAVPARGFVRSPPGSFNEGGKAGS